MNYFKYKSKTNERLGKTWELFRSMYSESSEVNNSHYNYTLDIVKSALSGNIDLSKDGVDDFNLMGYSLGCEYNNKLARRANIAKELFIVDSTSDEYEDLKVGFGDVSDTVLKYVDTLFDDILNDTSFEQSLNYLIGSRSKYIISDGIDILKILKNAINGVNSSVATLRKLVKKDSNLGHALADLLVPGKNEVLLERLSALGV